MDEYRLIYFHKVTGKEYRGKMVTRHDYVLIDPETLEKEAISRSRLLRDYKASAKNKRAGPKNRINFQKRS